jgi:hypothetical protein
MESVMKPEDEGGEVRIRSNICPDPDAWQLVPGELLVRCDLGPTYIPTPLQRDEKTYYRLCYVCKRTSFLIIKDGCDYPPCRLQGIKSKAEAEIEKQQNATVGE